MKELLIKLYILPGDLILYLFYSISYLLNINVGVLSKNERMSVIALVSLAVWFKLFVILLRQMYLCIIN